MGTHYCHKQPNTPPPPFLVKIQSSPSPGYSIYFCFQFYREKGEEEPGGPEECEFCMSSFKVRHNLQYHIRTHHKVKGIDIERLDPQSPNWTSRKIMLEQSENIID